MQRRKGWGTAPEEEDEMKEEEVEEMARAAGLGHADASGYDVLEVDEDDGYDDEDEDDDGFGLDMEELTVPVREVQLDGLVLLKMIKHSEDLVPEEVTGVLLGLDVSGKLEVTNCIPLPSAGTRDDDDDTDDAAAEEYQSEMMSNMREVNVDFNGVGWYRSGDLNSFLTEEVVDGQFDYQTSIKNSVLIVYDPQQSELAQQLGVKAFRLTNAFMKLYKSKSFTPDALCANGIYSSDVVEEVPLKVHNSHLVHGFLYELRNKNALKCGPERLSLATHDIMRKRIATLTHLIDGFGQEQNNFSYFQRQLNKQKQSQEAWLERRKAQNEALIAQGKRPLPEEDTSRNALFRKMTAPNYLRSVLITNNMDQQCDEINNSAMVSYYKMYLADQLQQQDAEVANDVQ